MAARNVSFLPGVRVIFLLQGLRWVRLKSQQGPQVGPCAHRADKWPYTAKLMPLAGSTLSMLGSSPRYSPRSPPEHHERGRGGRDRMSPKPYRHTQETALETVKWAKV